MYMKNEDQKLIYHIYENFSAKSVSSLCLHKSLLCLALYWKAEFSDLTPRADCSRIFSLLLRNSRIQFRRSMRWRGVSTDELQVVTN
jgi:hypothetical protein